MEKLLTTNVYMSRLSPTDSFKFLTLLKTATTKNVCEPKERENFTIPRMLRASGDLEGDSQVATILFIGIAKAFNLAPKDVMEFLGIEEEEHKFKLHKYREAMDSQSDGIATLRFKNKKKRIRNYIRIHAKDANVRFTTIF